MTTTKLENRSDRLFGRRADLTRLLRRMQRCGLTAIVGPPQIGKSWLLMELAYRLDRETNPRCLVGFTRSPKGANDPLLQVISDLYQRWLADAPAWEQLRAVWERQKDGLLPTFARFVGKLSEKAAKLVPILGELGGTAIREALEGLVTASENLRSGGQIVSRLEYTQAQELVSSVQKIAGQRISLIMDQWEETRDLDQQRNTFRDFLREPEQWPDCRIFVGAREGSDAAELLHDLKTEYPGGVDVHTLGEMNLVDGIERRRMISYLHAQAQLRALENIPDDRVLELVAGYPRVINRWTAEDARDTAKTFDGLRQLAQDANAFRYRDLEKLLRDLDGDRRKLAVRIALVPLVEAADVWHALRPIIFGNVDPNTLDDLKLSGVLEKEVESPSFGHPTRRETARSFLDARRQEAVRAEAAYLISGLARSVTVDPRVVYFGAGLVGLRDTAVRQRLGSLSLALCDAAVTLFGGRLPSPASLMEGAREARKSGEPSLGFLLAVGLFHSLNDAKAEGDLAHQDALLDELRALARTYLDDTVVHELLAGGLVNTLTDAKAKGDLARRDALLDELRALARIYPHEAYVREDLATGLLNTLNDAKAKGDLPRRDILLGEMRALARTYPDDIAVRELLADGLFNTLNAAKAEGDLAHRDALLDELRALARGYSDDSAVRKQLAGGLVNTLSYAKAEDGLARRDTLLYEVRVLAHAYPDDTNVREDLARGLFNTLNDAEAEGDFPLRDALLDELRTLAQDYSDDSAVRDTLAKGLVNMLSYANAQDDLARRDALLDQLRTLARTHSDDTVVRERLAGGLVNMMSYAKAEDDLARRDALLDQLRTLARTHSDDTAVRQDLARGLFSTLNAATFEGDLARRDTLLDELRALSQDYPDDSAVRDTLAEGLFNTVNFAKMEGDLARRDILLDELCAFARSYPHSSAVREQLAKAVYNTLYDAKPNDELARRDALLGELRVLARDYPDDATVCSVLEHLTLYSLPGFPAHQKS